MLPKIIVAGTCERKTLLSTFSLSPSTTMEYEGSEGKIIELRRFINFGINVSAGLSELSLVIWDADRLSSECQAVLLKPLESLSESMCLYLVVGNENGLLPTVISRCVVTSHLSIDVKTSSFWKKVLECFSGGPSKCLSFADELDKDEMEVVLEEVIVKLKSGLYGEVNKNRLKILKMTIDCLSKIRYTNVNAKLAFGNFLISSWKLIKA